MKIIQLMAYRIRASIGWWRSFCAARFAGGVPFRNTNATWGFLSQLLHWLVVFLIIVQWILARYASTQTLMAKILPLGLHKSFGITILALAALRLVWRLLNPTPSAPDDQRAWERVLARISHVALYALIIALPISGWLMSSARNFAVSWFGIFQLPALAGPDQQLFKQMDDLHRFLFTALLVIASLHVLGAFKHHYVDRNDMLRRMLPTWRAGSKASNSSVRKME